MLDLSHIPNSQQDVQIFYTNGITNAWQTWQKPRKCNYVWIMCIGGGGGGAGGLGSSGGNSTTGGGSGAVSRALYNAQQLPDRLYVQVGSGGAGGLGSSSVSGNSGSAGTRSIVTLQPSVVAQNIVAISGNAGAGGGSTTGASISGETVSTQTTATFYTLSNFISTAGIGNTAAGFFNVDITPLTSQITCPGGYGGGQSPASPFIGNGSSILATSISPLLQGGAGTVTSGVNGGNGVDGITSFKPFFSLGGSGGGNSLNGIGGNGGNGGIGSGGGSGGCSGTSGTGTGGNGGKGGDGIVIIISF